MAFQTTSSRKYVALGVLTALLCGVAGTALAATYDTGTLGVTATVTAHCTVTTTDLAFGNYDPNATTAQDSSAGKISTVCTKGSTPIIALGQGAHPTSTSTDAAPERQMSDGATTPSMLAYNIYTDSTYATVWGNTPTTGVTQASASADGTTAIDTIVYGRIAANQYVPAASYSDSVIVTISF